PLKREGMNVRNLAFSPDGQTLVASQYKGFIQFWDVATGHVRRSAQLHDPAHPNKSIIGFYQLHVSPDGKHVSTLERILGKDESTRVALWETATGKLVSQHGPFPQELYQAAWSADGMTVVLPMENGLTQMDVKTGAVRFRIPGASSGARAAAPEYRFIM